MARAADGVHTTVEDTCKRFRNLRAGGYVCLQDIMLIGILLSAGHIDEILKLILVPKKVFSVRRCQLVEYLLRCYCRVVISCSYGDGFDDIILCYCDSTRVLGT